MTTIYEQHEKTFASVSAFVIAKNGERVGTVAFKYPRDGAGRLLCYFHIIGCEMTRGYASGGGYDKHSAAADSAVKRISFGPKSNATESARAIAQKLRSTTLDGSTRWDAVLRDLGFEVWQAV